MNAFSQRAPRPFAEQINVTRPILPDLKAYSDQLADIWASGILTNGGAKAQQLERELARHLRVEQLSLFTNGTAALLVACRALGLSGEVIVTPFTFAATVHALDWCGLTPVFVDIDPVTMTIDPARIEEAITKDTSAIMAVHVYGTPCDVASIAGIARARGLKVIYDAAHAFGTMVNGRSIADYGDATMFSFHATKLFHTAEGGALVVRERGLKERVDLMRNFGIASETEIKLSGINGKISELQAAMGLCVLPMVEEDKARRYQIMRQYEAALSDLPHVTLPTIGRIEDSSCQYYCIRIERSASGLSRDSVYSRLREFNVYTRRYFWPLCSEIPNYRHLPSAAPANLPQAHLAGDEVLCLPLYSELTADQVGAISNMIRFALSGS